MNPLTDAALAKLKAEVSTTPFITRMSIETSELARLISEVEAAREALRPVALAVDDVELPPANPPYKKL